MRKKYLPRHSIATHWIRRAFLKYYSAPQDLKKIEMAKSSSINNVSASLIS